MKKNDTPKSDRLLLAKEDGELQVEPAMDDSRKAYETPNAQPSPSSFEKQQVLEAINEICCPSCKNIIKSKLGVRE